MGVKRKQHGARGGKTLAEVSSDYRILHPTMISTWKQELIQRTAELFALGNKKAADLQKVIDEFTARLGGCRSNGNSWLDRRTSSKRQREAPQRRFKTATPNSFTCPIKGIKVLRDQIFVRP